MATERKRKAVCDIVIDYDIVSRKTGNTYNNAYVELSLSGLPLRFYTRSFLSELEFSLLEKQFNDKNFLTEAKQFTEDQLKNVFQKEI